MAELTASELLSELGKRLEQTGGLQDLGERMTKMESLNRQQGLTIADMGRRLRDSESKADRQAERILSLEARVRELEEPSGLVGSPLAAAEQQAECFQSFETATFHTMTEEENLGAQYSTFSAQQELLKESSQDDIQVSLKEGMDYEWDESLSPALLEACTSGEAATVSDLLRRKANPNCRDDQGMAPLLWAARKGRTEVARILLDHDPPADINASRDQNGWTALHAATVMGCVDVAQVLLSHNADINATDSLGRTPLHFAAAWDKLTDVLLSNEPPANLEVTTDLGWTALHEAAFIANIKVVQILVARGVSVELEDNEGATALQLAEKKLRESDHKKDQAVAAQYQLVVDFLRDPHRQDT